MIIMGSDGEIYRSAIGWIFWASFLATLIPGILFMLFLPNIIGILIGVLMVIFAAVIAIALKTTTYTIESDGLRIKSLRRVVFIEYSKIKRILDTRDPTHTELWIGFAFSSDTIGIVYDPSNFISISPTNKSEVLTKLRIKAPNARYEGR